MSKMLTTAGSLLLMLLQYSSKVSAEDSVVEAPPAVSRGAEPQSTSETALAPVEPRHQLDVKSVPARTRQQFDPERAPSYTEAAPDTGKKKTHLDTTWMIVGIGGSIAASSIATGATLMATNEDGSSARNVGAATLVGGITGLVFALAVAALEM